MEWTAQGDWIDTAMAEAASMELDDHAEPMAGGGLWTPGETKDYIRNVHINELWSEYPYKEFFGLLKTINYNRYMLAEIQDNPQAVRFLRMYRALWLELSR